MKLTRIQSQIQDRTGAMLPMVAVSIIILFVAVSFAVDIARMHLTRSELRTATDAAARAAVEALSRENDLQRAKLAAVEVAQRNIVAGSGLTIDTSDIVFGTSTEEANGKFSFTASNSLVNAAQVLGKRTADSADGPVTLFFGPILGTDTFSPTASSTAVRLDRDIALVLDESGSMNAAGRFPALLNGLNVFLTEMERSVPEERVSLVVYDTFPEKLVNMTGDTFSIRNAMATRRPGGATGIGRALALGIDSVQNDPGSRGNFALQSVVVMTDGNHNAGENPLSVAARAQNAGIIVHTITFSSGANQGLMRQVAERTGGIHVHADNNQQLNEAFDTIAKTIQVMTIQ